MNRRDFIKLLGVTSGGSLVASCDLQKKTEKLIPYLVPPEEDIIPGQAIYYNTTCAECPAHCGVTAKVHDKIHENEHRLFPTKLEGVAGHPINDGTLCVRGQASLTRLYHLSRLKSPMQRNAEGNFIAINWETALNRISDGLAQAKAQNKSNVYLSGRTTGTLLELIDEFCQKTEVERLPEYEALNHAAIREANRLLFEQPDIPSYHIEKADFLLTMGADILETFVSPVSHSLQFGRAKKRGEFHWFHVEPAVSITGLAANERFVLLPESETYLLAYLLQSILRQSKAKEKLPAKLIELLPNPGGQEVAGKTGLSVEQIQRIFEHLSRARNPLLIAGGVATGNASGLSAALLAGLIQWTLGMTDLVVDFSESQGYARLGSLRDVEGLGNRLAEGKVGVVFIANTDPVKTLPATLDFGNKLRQATLRIGISDMITETMKECDIILPLSHYLESWGDAEPRRGLRALMQPVLDPLYDTASEGDILLRLIQMQTSQPNTQTYQEYLLQRWKQHFNETQFEEFLRRGFVSSSAAKTRIALKEDRAEVIGQAIKLPVDVKMPALQIVPSVRSFDGRSRVLSLLQEIPDPLTTISYGEWISVSAEMAVQHQLHDLDEIEVGAMDWTVKLPVRIQAGLPSDLCMVQRDLLPKIPGGMDSASGEHISLISGITIRKTGQRIAIPILSGAPNPNQSHRKQDQEHEQEQEKEHEHEGNEIAKPAQMYKEHTHKDYRWAMAIDLNVCTGCSACVAACYLENNIPIVGRQLHLKGREMSWISIRPEQQEDEQTSFVPMLCQHCDHAPCEAVCPTFAAYHTPEGLNAQIYNRCVGTRYCANNCPYKVRRFNWFDHNPQPEPVKFIHNPDVSLRGRGVMEKCTFCVQRIRAAKDHAKDEGRPVQDGEVIPACAQSCPTQAIVFGNILDPESSVAKLSRSQGAFRVLEKLNTEPAVRYIKKEREG